MWREFFESFGRPCFFGEPAVSEAVLQLEQALRVVLPPDLRAIFFETDGLSLHPAFFNEIGEEEDTVQILWTLDEIRERNIEFREWDHYPDTPFAHFGALLFFASEPNGDPVGFIVAEGKVAKPEIIVMSHEDYRGRRVECDTLRGYLTVLLEACQ